MFGLDYRRRHALQRSTSTLGRRWIRWSALPAVVGAIVLAMSGVASACPGIDEPCRIDGGEYRILLPEGMPNSKPPVMLHLHGWGGTSEGVLQSDFAKTFLSRGFAVIAPQGLKARPESNTNWSVVDGNHYARNDVAFVRAVLNDAAKRFGLNREDVLLTGFSRGASMVWDIACLAPDTARAYAPVAGGFWAPFPTDCEGPVRLLHTHGFSDMTVPLEGRPLRSGAMVQSDIFAGLQLWRRVDGCGSRAGAHDVSGPIWRKTWTDCKAGTIEFALHAGSHEVPKGWAQMAIEWFDALPPGPIGQQG